MAILNEHFQTGFCLVDWVINLLHFIEKNNIQIEFFQITPFFTQSSSCITLSPDEIQKPKFTVLFDICLYGDGVILRQLVDTYLKKTMLKPKTHFLLLEKAKSLNDLHRPFLSISTQLFEGKLPLFLDQREDPLDSREPFELQVPFFSSFLEKPVWSIDLSRDWLSFFYRYQKNAQVKPGVRGFLEISEEIQLAPFFVASDFDSERKKNLLLKFIFHHHFLDSMFQSLVKPENWHFVNFQSYGFSFDEKNLVLRLYPHERPDHYCILCEGFCHKHEECHYYEVYNDDFECECECDLGTIAKPDRVGVIPSIS